MNDQVTMPETGESPEQPQMGMPARFMALFTDPRRAFAAVRKNWEWLLIILIVSVVGIASFQIAKPIYIKDQLASTEEALDRFNVPEERQAEILEEQEQNMSNPAMQLIGPVATVIILVIVSAILFFITNVLLGGQSSFLLVMNMYALTWLVTIPEAIVKVPLILSKGSTQVHLSLAVLLPSDQINTFMGQIFNQLGIFPLWQLILVMLGVSVLAKAPFAKSATFVGILWVIWVLISAGLAQLGINMAGM